MSKVMFEQKTIEEALDAAETAVMESKFLSKDRKPSDSITLMIIDVAGAMYMKEFKEKILIQLGIKEEEK